MTPATSIQDILYQALSSGDVTGAAQAVARGADVTASAKVMPGDQEGDAATRAFDAADRLVTAAARAPNEGAMDWLVAMNPDLIPSGAAAVMWLGKTLAGSPGAPDLWFADWLVAHTPVVESLNSQADRNHKPWSNLVFKSLARTDQTALAWLLKPTSGWADDPTDPILVRALKHDHITDYERNTPHVVFLLRVGSRPLTAPDPTHPEGARISPLSELVNAYCSSLQMRAKDGQRHSSTIDYLYGDQDVLPQSVITLWPLLVQAGDDPHRRLSSGLSPRELIRGTPAEEAVVAFERQQATLAENPPRARARRRRS